MSWLNTTVKIGKKSPKFVKVPDADHIMIRMMNESVMTFGKSQYGENKYRQFFAIGRIDKIVKGEDLDCLWVNFGIEKKSRCIICTLNNVRRQISLCKRGWYCTFYGLMKIMIVKRTGPNGEIIRKPRWVMFAHAINPWYVPKTMEIKKEPNDHIEELNETDNKELINFLDQFKEGEDENE